MTMTIEVYRINPETGSRTPLRAKRTVKPANMPELGQKYPPCMCTRCVDSAVRLHTKLAEVNRRSRGEL